MVAGYRVDGILGEGGMGIVYRATQVSLNRTIALKVLATDISDDPAFRERFRREGLLQAAIDHPHIVTVYEAGETEHGLFLAMRLVRGATLKDMILARELDAGRSTRILGMVADALATAHDVGLTHRDVKPQNILIGARDHAYLADFGLTKAPDETGLTDTGQFVGTIDYVSPEQIRGEGASARSDIYSLTGVLYECITGAIPFSKPTESAVVYAHIAEPPPKVTEKRPDLPPALDDVIAKGMAKDPEARYASPRELMDAAEQAFGQPAQALATPPGPIAAAEEAGVRATAPGVTATSPAMGETAPSPAAGVPAGVPTTAAPASAGPTAPAATAPVRDRRLGLAVPVAVAAVLLAIVGYLAGNSGSSEERPELASSASAGSLGLSFPVGWKRVQENPGIPGIKFSQPIVLAAATGPGEQERAIAGMVEASGPTLLPSAFLKRLDREPGRTDPVRLGKLQAYRYSGLEPKGFRRALTLYAAPTSRGVATVACTSAPSGGAPFLRDCEEAATTLSLSGAKALPLGPSAAYADRLGRALRDLDAGLKAGAKKLRAADTPSAQAAAASALGQPYERAARAISRTTVSPADRKASASLVGALRGLARDYREAASSARVGDSAAYAAAGSALRRDGARLRKALKALEALGYSVS